MNTLRPISSASPRWLEEAVLSTLAYADLFDFPLTFPELRRYLHGRSATTAQLDSTLQTSTRLHRLVRQYSGYYLLTGRESLAEIRRQRAETARTSLPRAVKYGQHLAHLPFIRMVALTGSLAVGNPSPGADFDYFIITAPGRLWLARALVVLLVRWAYIRTRDVLCPNFLISEGALEHPQQNIYTAHEIAQMLPLAGNAVYARFRSANAWTSTYLPNAAGSPPITGPGIPDGKAVKQSLEWLLGLPVWNHLEAWEMQRKIRQFQPLGRSAEIHFSPDWCQGHFNGHAQATLQRHHQNLDRLARQLQDGAQ